MEKYIQAFFDNIAQKIEEYKITKQDEKKRIKIEELEKIEKEKILLQKQIKEEEEIRITNQRKRFKG